MSWKCFVAGAVVGLLARPVIWPLTKKGAKYGWKRHQITKEKRKMDGIEDFLRQRGY